MYVREFVLCLSLSTSLFAKLYTGSIGVPAIRFVEAITKDTRQANGGRLVYGFASRSQRLAASPC
jgi:hypothetical protein